ncbi:MAG: fibronectin type III domain-containing protein [Caldisericia bacterium]
MKKLTIILVLISIIFTFNLKFTFGITYLDKPSNPCAYSSGTSIFLEWSYSYLGLGTVYFEIYEWNGISWVLKDDTTKYPENKKTFTGQSLGTHIYRIRAKEIFLFTTNYSSYTSNLYAYVLNIPSGLKVEHVSNKYDLKLNWNPVDTNANKIEIWRNTVPGPDFPTKIATIDKSLTTYIDETVLPNTTYKYSLTLRRFDDTSIHDDFSGWTSEVQIKTFPKGINSLSGSGQGNNIYLTWSYINFPSGTTILGFKIYERITLIPLPPLPPIITWILIYTLSNSTFTKNISGVSYGSHTYQVRTYNSDGESFDNITLTVYSLKTPTNLIATPISSNSIKLNWDQVDTNATSIVISRSVDGLIFTGLTSISSTNTSYIDTTCSPNTQYWYKIKVKRDLNESSFSNTDSAKTLPLGSPPASPTNLVGTAINCNQIDITWQDNATDETNYVVERKIEGGSYSVIITLPANTNVYSDTSVSPNTKYYYRVKAKNSFGDSGYSNEINISTPLCGIAPNAPTNLNATPASSSQINLSWSDNSDNEDGFRIERKIEGGSYSEITTVGANVNTFSDSSLLPDTKYYYRVRAYNTFGQSAFSNEASAKTNPLGTPPNAPTNLNANALSCNQVQLNWVDNSDNENGFRIERKEGTGSYEVISNTGPDIETFVDDAVSENKTYTYKVIAFNEYGESSSNEKIVSTPLCGTKPVAPSNLDLLVLSPTQIKVSFTDNSDNEDGFKVERKELGSTYSEIKTLPANTTEFIDNVNPNTTYYYRVRAFNSYGYSLYSDEANETTPQVGVPPNSPTNLITSASSCNEVLLIWIDNSNNEDGFKIERKEEGGSYSLITTLTSNTTLFNDTTTSGNKKYYYRVYAFNSYGVSNFSNESIVTTPPCGNKPNAPSNLFGEAISKSEISLSWKDNSDNEDGFILERKEEGGSYDIITTLPKDTNKYSDKNLIPDKTYYYRVKAFNSYGESDYSNELKIKTPKDIELIILRFYIGKTIYYQNDEMKNMDVAPMILEGRTLLPIRYVAEALGANVGWEAKEQKVTINFKGIIIELWIGKNLATVNGEYKLIDPSNPNVKPITIPPGRTMLPIRFIAENLGCKVDWNPDLKEVKITYP